MKKQFPAIMLGIGCVALLIAYTHSNQKIAQLREEVAKLQAQDKPVGSNMETAPPTKPPSPEQYTAFEKCLKTQTDMQLSQLEMAAQMFGGGTKTESK